MHKTVVQISGNNMPKERQVIDQRNAIASASAANRKFLNSTNGNNSNNNSNINRLTISNKYKDIRNIDLEKSRSLDSEYDKYHSNIRIEFDKSRSFDENYGESTNQQGKYAEHVNYPRNIKHSQNSPQKYGNRNDMLYDKNRKSIIPLPLLNYKQEQHQANMKAQHMCNNREQSPNSKLEPIYKAVTKSYEHLQSAISAQHPQQQQYSSLMHTISPTKRISIKSSASPHSDYDLTASDFNVDHDLCSYYSGKNIETFSNQRRRETMKLMNKNHATGIPTSSSPSTVSTARYLRN